MTIIEESHEIEDGPSIASSTHIGGFPGGHKCPRVNLADIVVDLMTQPSAVEMIISRTGADTIHADHRSGRPPLSVISANLDHIAQFGRGGRWQETLGDSLTPSAVPFPDEGRHNGGPAVMEWLTLLDGAPLVAQANRLTGQNWPRLAGSDLIGPVLAASETSGITVGFLGGSYLIQRLLSRQLTKANPHLLIAGMWSPDRAALVSHRQSLELAATIKESGAQILIVGLGKPRQELWMAKYGIATGADVLLAFGAVVDFLAGAINRAPQWASNRGLEWAWRLALEPRRLARRYLVDDPPSLLHLRRYSALVPDHAAAVSPQVANLNDGNLIGIQEGTFVAAGDPADVVVFIVTYNSETALGGLIASLRQEARSLRLRVIVADNDSSDGTFHSLDAHPDAYALSTGGNLGYASGINTARRVAGDSDAVLILNPDLEVLPGAITALYRRLVISGAGLVVPNLLETDGSIYQSLRREPTVATAFGDAFFGATWPSRPGWLAETDYTPESYQHAHRIDWASGAAIMVRAEVAQRLGDWDEQFFLYSEEVDYFRRARESGDTAWYEPSARMIHHGGGSGTSPQLNALLAVNRIRYVRKYHDARYARWFRRGVILTEALRLYKPTRLEILRTLRDQASWDYLPGPTAAERLTRVLDDFPKGTVIIPAHNEASVIADTLSALVPVLETGRVQVIVAANGCTDETAAIAASFKGVDVIRVEGASKIAALNAADAMATGWPRLYLDADIRITPTALRMVFDRLKRGDVSAARPAFRYDDTGASYLVRAFYRARRRIQSTDEALWGAGAYALTESGHEKFPVFPDVTADDLFVDRQFDQSEKKILHTPPVEVRTPRTVPALLAILRRNYKGQHELLARTDHGTNMVSKAVESTENRGAATNSTLERGSTRETVRQLLGSIHGPLSAFDAAIYAFFVSMARAQRLMPGTNRVRWERDDSSRKSKSLESKS